ncbi:MAG: aspartate dehydrogenase [Alphaproteobacteria bacterium]|nr:aspartate dehydrogenase [Alphaproteobacteria bacterium]
MMRIALIGYGTIAASVARLLPGLAQGRAEIVGALAKPGRAEQARAKLAGVTVVESLDDLLALRPTIVAECAGHGAVAAHGAGVLAAGVDLMVVSTGALTDDALSESLRGAARTARVLIPAGAVGGIDALAAMRLGGLDSVRYRSIKPPAAWRGTPAEMAVDLDRLTAPTVAYRGTARDAARLYPKNANVAATVALAGIGFERTTVEVVADPGASHNVHEVEARGASGELSLRLVNLPSPDNPKTSALTALSVVRALLNEALPVAI